MIECEEGTRHRLKYYEIANLYATITDKSLTLSISDPDLKTRTRVGLGCIESLVTLCLQEGIDKELIASALWENSAGKGDIADSLSFILLTPNDKEVTS